MEFIVISQGFTTWIVIPALIFLARILDVSIGTLRVIFVARGMRMLAPALGFFEVLIWLLAIGQILQNLTNWQNYIAYAAGFATGNWVGMVIENKLALGNVLVRIITHRDPMELAAHLRNADYGITTLNAEGKTGPVKVLLTVISRQELQQVIKIVNQYHPKAFYSIEDIRFAKEGIFPMRKSFMRQRYISFWELLKKSK